MIEHRPGFIFFCHALLIASVMVVAFPLYIGFVASTHTALRMLQYPLPLLPGAEMLHNYAAVLKHGVEGASAAPVGQMMWNSLVMALTIAIGKITISILSAFAIVYFRFPLKNFFFWMIFITLMLPVEVRILPTYKVVADLGLLDTYAGLSVPLIASATATFLFRQFFLTIPDELMEAARIDGAGAHALFLGRGAAAVEDQYRRAVRDPVHLRLEPVPVAIAGDDAGGHVHRGDRHQAHDPRRRRLGRLESGHGHGHARARAAGAGGAADAALVRQGTGGHGEVDSMAKLELRNVRKSFGSLEIIKGVSIDIADGEFVVIVGPSGCGKSTLLRMVAGLEAITSGEILIGERVVNNLEPKDRDIAMVFQNYALYPHMSVRQNMAYGLKIRGFAKDDIETRVQRAAKILELGDLLSRKPRELSGGQRQRVAMGRAIVREPSVFLFDEPLSNLDAKLRVQMRLEIQKLHRNLGTTSVYVTHDQVEAMTLAERMIVMSAGRTEQIGTPAEVYQHPATQFVAGFIGSPAMNLLRGRADASGLALADGGHLTLSVPAALDRARIGARHPPRAPRGVRA